MSNSSADSELNAQIYEEASEWLIEFRTHSADALSRERLDAWLRKSPEHVRAYLELSAIWEDTALHDPQRSVSAEAHIARARAGDNVVALISRSLEPSEAPSRHQQSSMAPGPAGSDGPTLPPRETRFTWRLVAAAASLILGSIGVWRSLQPDTYATAVGEQHSIALPDGSVVQLDASSRIRVRLSKSERDVDLLEGQALFQVAHDAGRPFIVRSGTALVRAVGTQFDVYRKKRGTIITVIEGQVAVAPPEPGTIKAHSMILLSAGEQVTVLPESVSQPTRANMTATQAWMQRRLVFDSTPLSEVVDEFNRYNTHKLVVDDPELQKLEIIGVFSSTDPGSLIRFLRAQPGVLVIEGAHETRIDRSS